MYYKPPVDGEVFKVEHKDRNEREEGIMAQQDMRNADYYVSIS